MRFSILSLAGLCLVAATGACGNTQEPINAGFGDAYYHNISVHVIDPAPANAGSGAPALDGERGRLAIDRYRSTTTVRPVTVTTSGVGDTSSGGN